MDEMKDLIEELTEQGYEIAEQPKGTLLSVVLDKDGYVQQYCTGANLGNETTHFYTDIPEDFYTNYKAYRYIDLDNALVLDKDKLTDVAAEHELENLRAQREIECFSIVNRGKLWYDRLTKEQLEELDSWYQAWLDVTESKVKSGYKIPAKPRWLE